MSFLIIILSTLLSALFGFLRYKYSYWESRGVKQSRTHFLYGNLFKMKTYHMSEIFQEAYDQFKGKARLAGTYLLTKPVAVVLDLDLAKSILLKDFNNFIDRVEYKNLENDPLSGHLFAIEGEKWRPLRNKLTPTFSSGKMKFMFPTIVKVAKEFESAMDAHLNRTSDGVIEIYDFMGRYTTEVIGTCAFGIECNSLKNPNVEFRQMGRKIIVPSSRPVRWRLFLQIYANYFKYVGIRRFTQSLEDWMVGVVKETVTMREKHNIHRNDFIDLLIELKNSNDAEKVPVLTLYEMAAQVFVFFAAGFETSSSNMTFGLYEMAKQPNIQEKVRQEIKEVLAKYNGVLTYEAMMEMKYLDQVISETVRKYPALATLSRITQNDYKIPETDIILEKGITVHIPVVAIHHDPDIYPNPNEFIPERFSSEEINNRHPQAFLGFGDGPRNCIGLRFGRMQVRIGLITLLQRFRFSVCDKTPKSMKISDHSFVLTPGVDVLLKVEKISV